MKACVFSQIQHFLNFEDELHVQPTLLSHDLRQQLVPKPPEIGVLARLVQELLHHLGLLRVGQVVQPGGREEEEI